MMMRLIFPVHGQDNQQWYVYVHVQYDVFLFISMQLFTVYEFESLVLKLCV